VGGREPWDRIAFYNFVQSPVQTPSTPPTRQQFEASGAAFAAVIEALRPDRVLVCGQRLWGYMPPTPYDIGVSRELYFDPDIHAYSLADGTPVWCLVIGHPSRAFGWREWRPVISLFLDDPAKAAPLLSERRAKKKAARSGNK
jgi:hypothetical protein